MTSHKDEVFFIHPLVQLSVGHKHGLDGGTAAMNPTFNGSQLLDLQDVTPNPAAGALNPAAGDPNPSPTFSTEIFNTKKTFSGVKIVLPCAENVEILEAPARGFE